MFMILSSSIGGLSFKAGVFQRGEVLRQARRSGPPCDALTITAAPPEVISQRNVEAGTGIRKALRAP
jgi:hypothetical protein